MTLPTPQPSGLLLFDKPAGITSHDAVDLLRKKLSFRRIGHGGTLDPMATGLLIMLVGSATKAQSSVQCGSKVYSGVITFGSETDTWDAQGRVTGTAAVPDLSRAAVAKAVAAFSGRIVQQVPPYSAIRHNGKHLYDLARQNAAVPEIKREVDVRWLSWSAGPASVAFEIECSGGTYLRSIARELGLAMGSLAHLSVLRRLSIGSYRVENAVTAEQLGAMTPAEAAARLAPAPVNG